MINYNVLNYPQTVIDRFWSKVNIVYNLDGTPDFNKCMVRLCGLSIYGYSRIWFNSKRWLSHRFVYTCFYGNIPQDLLVCHTCDNHPCVNPHHLWIGTNQQNTYDRVLKDRSAKGERNGFSKLEDLDIHIIRKLLPIHTRQEIADIFNVSKAAIFRIQNKTTWNHVK
jgi:hypothetical protein